MIVGLVSVEGSHKMSCSGLEGCDFEDLDGFADFEVVPRILMGLNGDPPSEDITGASQDVITGQQVQLAASYLMPEDAAVDDASWSVDGTTASGWEPGIGTDPVNTEGDETLVYWTVPGNGLRANFTLDYSDSNGDEQANALTTFNALGPSTVSVTPGLGRWDIDSDGLAFGDDFPLGNVGISFSAHASPPAGAGNNFTWAQVITALSGTCAAAGTQSQIPEPSPPFHDGVYPYAVGSSTNDNPFLGIFPGAGDETYSIAATMYLLWDPGPSFKNALPVPLGYLSWGASGHAFTPAGGTTLAVAPDSTQTSDAGLTETSEYPIWPREDAAGPVKCVSNSGGEAFKKRINTAPPKMPSARPAVRGGLSGAGTRKPPKSGANR